jgi:hypothetical protein
MGGLLSSCFGQASDYEFASGREVSVLKTLGEGGFSIVYLVKDRAGTLYALVRLWVHIRRTCAEMLLIHVADFFAEAIAAAAARAGEGIFNSRKTPPWCLRTADLVYCLFPCRRLRMR